ncbi:MAG TPA: glycosyltransferase family 4 protein [Candidatus Acidoferrales bacterium]|nr:glycosyltransferase family 4 protein [Candidatus Acidoferrales bacterium]
MKIWFPVIRAHTGTDVFSRRLAEALGRWGICAEITWFPSRYEFFPFVLRSERPPAGTQIIHANSWSGFAFARYGIPLVVTEHLNVLDPAYRPYKNRAQATYHTVFVRRFMKASFAAAAAITAVSDFVRSSLAQRLNIHAQTIPNWIDTRLFRPGAARPARRSTRFRLLFSANPSRRKGADLLVRIMEELGAEFELHFTLGPGGRNPIAPAPNITPIARVACDPDLVAVYRRADALLLPTRFEGFGLAALEAMACGKPVVATDCCSLPEVVGDGSGGILCPLDDVEAFAAACRRLARDPPLRAKLSAGARERAEKLFAEQCVIPQYLAVYEKLLR